VLRRIAIEYGLAALAVVGAAAFRFALDPVLHGQAGFLLSVPAILVGSAFGGWKAGILSTVVSLVIGGLFIVDFRSPSAADLVNGVVFALVGIAASWRGELLHRARVSALSDLVRMVLIAGIAGPD
jgi:Domain of unknown function (DUF4118)